MLFHIITANNYWDIKLNVKIIFYTYYLFFRLVNSENILDSILILLTFSIQIIILLLNHRWSSSKLKIS